jgi:hypothetical protein
MSVEKPLPHILPEVVSRNFGRDVTVTTQAGAVFRGLLRAAQDENTRFQLNNVLIIQPDGKAEVCQETNRWFEITTVVKVEVVKAPVKK